MREVYKVKNGWGYRITTEKINIIQEHKPCYNGILPMTEDEAIKLSELVEQKIIQGVSPAVSKEEMADLFSSAKSWQQLIDERKVYLLAHPPKPPNLPK